MSHHADPTRHALSSYCDIGACRSCPRPATCRCKCHGYQPEGEPMTIDTTTDLLACDKCDRTFDKPHALRIHLARSHKIPGGPVVKTPRTKINPTPAEHGDPFVMLSVPRAWIDCLDAVCFLEGRTLEEQLAAMVDTWEDDDLIGRIVAARRERRP